MPHTIRMIGLLALALAAATVPAAAPPPRPLGTAEVQRLIEQLGDRDYRARERAERLLEAEGRAALPLLRRAMGHQDPEVRKRAQRLVPALEHAAIVAPKRVTLIVKNQPLRTIFDQLGKQSGYKIQHMGGAVAQPQQARGGWVLPVFGAVGGKAAPKEPVYTYNFINEPFWDVVERLCRDFNMQIQQGYGDDTVRLYQGAGYAPHAGTDGAFRFAATGLQMYRNIDLNAVNPTGGGAAGRTETLTLTFALFAEPRLPFLNMGETRLEAAYDNERNSMMLKPTLDPNNEGGMWAGGRWFGRRGYYGGDGYKQMTLQASVNLLRVSEKATRIKVIKGVVPMTLLVEQKPVDVSDDIMKGKGKKVTVGTLEFHVEDVQKKAGGQVDVKFTVTNKGNPNDYMWQNTLYQRLELLDAKGVKYQNWGTNWHGGGGNNVSVTMSFSSNNGAAKPGEAKRFVYQQWVSRQHDINFEFRDVPLP